jgi:hypothetical protein
MEKFTESKVVKMKRRKPTTTKASFLDHPHKTYSLNHNVCAIFPDYTTADEAREHLIEQGFAESEINILQDEFPNHGQRRVMTDMDDEVLTLTCVDFGTNRTAIMISSNVTLFVAKRLLKSLVWNDTLITVNSILNGAIKTGCVLLHLQTDYESDKELAKEILSESLEQQGDIALASYQ